MPIVTIQVTREGTTPGTASLTAEEKAALIRGSSQLLRDVLGKPLDSTFGKRSFLRTCAIECPDGMMCPP